MIKYLKLLFSYPPFLVFLFAVGFGIIAERTGYNAVAASILGAAIAIVIITIIYAARKL